MPNFHASAEDIRVEDGHILKARLQAADGSYRDAEFDLNQVIGNEDGRFEWGGMNFSESADDINFELEGGGEPILRAMLQNREGEPVAADINLAERIDNQDGEFGFD